MATATKTATKKATKKAKAPAKRKAAKQQGDPLSEIPHAEGKAPTAKEFEAVVRTCKCCDTEFKRYPSNNRAHYLSGGFCSSKCQAKYYKDNKDEKRLSAKEREAVTATCQNAACKKEYKRYAKSDWSRHLTWFCCKTCQTAHYAAE